jgi:hypothetical protein
MITPDPLIRTLTSLVAELACFIDTTVDEDGEPRAAAKQLDVIAGAFDRLDPEQRGKLTPRRPSRWQQLNPPRRAASSCTPSRKTSV